MLPQILQQLNRNSVGQIQQMAQLLKGNPIGMLQNMPQYRQAMDLVQQSGGDAQAAFYKLAQQRGVDPNEILRYLK
jgi:hypothetical protein